ncbi:CHAT domain-containing protein [Micromonospora humida]|uniref:CHAT domain-containing protein n=1 Tax=Micromonospora humida TaxID=2809018 RepID=UPI00343EB1A8
MTAAVLRDAGRAAVSAAMGTHGWLHYAGHSRTDLGDPGASGLELADGRLTFQEIAALRLPTARFACLSSCETGAGSARLPDEVLHLCGAAQLAGYQRVVGTYWPVTDRAAAMVAAELYERMDTGGDLDPGLAADALHKIARRLRTVHAVTTWAAYFHAGP